MTRSRTLSFEEKQPLRSLEVETKCRIAICATCVRLVEAAAVVKTTCSAHPAPVHKCQTLAAWLLFQANRLLLQLPLFRP